MPVFCVQVGFKGAFFMSDMLEPNSTENATNEDIKCLYPWNKDYAYWWVGRVV
jgi:hypothetical protein